MMEKLIARHVADYVGKVKERAQECLRESLEAADEGPLNLGTIRDMLWSYPYWEAFLSDGGVYSQPATDRELIKMNREFNPVGCFGRVVLGMLLIEKYFPDAVSSGQVTIAEVIEDHLAGVMLDKMSRVSDPQKRMEMARELLMYEDPHAVLIIKTDDGKLVQFDPLSLVYGKDIVHPRVKVVENPWRAIAAISIVNDALAKDDMVARSIDLDRADLICPNLAIVLQSQVGVLLAMETKNLDRHPIVDRLVGIRPSARVLFALYGCRGIVKYPREVEDVLMEEFLNNNESIRAIVENRPPRKWVF